MNAEEYSWVAIYLFYHWPHSVYHHCMRKSFLVKMTAYKEHFISFPICEEFVTSWYKIPCCLKVFKTKHIIVLRACLFLSIIFFFFSLLKPCLFIFVSEYAWLCSDFLFSSPKIVWRIRYWISRGFLKLF